MTNDYTPAAIGSITQIMQIIKPDIYNPNPLGWV